MSKKSSAWDEDYPYPDAIKKSKKRISWKRVAFLFGMLLLCLWLLVSKVKSEWNQFMHPEVTTTTTTIQTPTEQIDAVQDAQGIVVVNTGNAQTVVNGVFVGIPVQGSGKLSGIVPGVNSPNKDDHYLAQGWRSSCTSATQGNSVFFEQQVDNGENTYTMLTGYQGNFEYFAEVRAHVSRWWLVRVQGDTVNGFGWTRQEPVNCTTLPLAEESISYYFNFSQPGQ